MATSCVNLCYRNTNVVRRGIAMLDRMSMASKSMLNAQALALARSRLSYRCYNHLSKIYVALGSTPYSTKNPKVTASHQAHSLLSPCKLLSQQKATARKFSQRSLGQDNLLDVSVDSSSGYFQLIFINLLDMMITLSFANLKITAC